MRHTHDDDFRHDGRAHHDSAADHRGAHHDRRANHDEYDYYRRSNHDEYDYYKGAAAVHDDESALALDPGSPDPLGMRRRSEVSTDAGRRSQTRRMKRGIRLSAIGHPRLVCGHNAGGLPKWS
jgi:hypothetical protein